MEVGEKKEGGWRGGGKERRLKLGGGTRKEAYTSLLF